MTKRSGKEAGGELRALAETMFGGQLSHSTGQNAPRESWRK